MQLRFSFSLVLSEPEQSRPQSPRPNLTVVDTTGETVETQIRPIAKCGPVVELELWRKRRAAR